MHISLESTSQAQAPGSKAFRQLPFGSSMRPIGLGSYAGPPENLKTTLRLEAFGCSPFRTVELCKPLIDVDRP